MIHVATVHFQSDKWVELQLHYLRRHFDEPFRTYACLNEIPAERRAQFDDWADLAGTHAEKLNELARRISEQAAADDLLVFVDGDAFPISDCLPRLRQLLAEYPLVAVQRAENLGDPQPHPCFCVTTVGFWREIGGDWSKGHTWLNSEGRRVTDVGGNLLGALEERGAAWYPLLRTNVRELHPLLFAVYGDMAYHHGGGFRRPTSRVDRPSSGRVGGWRQSALGRAFGRLKQRVARPFTARLAARNQRLSDTVFARIEADDDYIVEFFLDGRVPAND